MGGMFAKEPKKGGKAKPKPQITERDRAVLDLKLARDKIKKTMKAMDSEADKLTDQARVLVKSGRKDRALTVLRLRNMKVANALPPPCTPPHYLTTSPPHHGPNPNP